MMEGGSSWDVICVVTFGVRSTRSLLMMERVLNRRSKRSEPSVERTRCVRVRFWRRSQEGSGGCAGHACYAQETIADEMFGFLR